MRRVSTTIRMQKSVSQEESISIILLTHLKPFFSKFDTQRFRENKLWNGTVQKMLEYNIEMILDIYHKYTGRFSKSRVKYMSCPEFIDLVEQLDIFTTPADVEITPVNDADLSVSSISRSSESTLKSELGDLVVDWSEQSNPNFKSSIKNAGLQINDVPIIFFTSLMSRINELSASKHANMTLVEFLEALARIADKANLEEQLNQLDIDYYSTKRESSLRKTGRSKVINKKRAQ